MFRAVADDCIVETYCQTRSPEWRGIVERDDDDGGAGSLLPAESSFDAAW